LDILGALRLEEHGDEPVNLLGGDTVHLGERGMSAVEINILENCTIKGKTFFDCYCSNDWTALQSLPIEITFHEKPIPVRGYRLSRILNWIAMGVTLICITGIVWIFLKVGGVL